MRIICHSLFITASSSHWIMSSVRIRGLLISVFIGLSSRSSSHWIMRFYWFEFVFEWRLHVLMLMMNYQPGSCFIGCRLFEIFSSLIRIMFDQLLICESCCFCDSWADERSLTKHQIQSCSSRQTHALFISQSYFTAMILISNKQFFITRSRLTALLWCFLVFWIELLQVCVFIWAAGQRDVNGSSVLMCSVFVSLALPSQRTKSSTCINAFVLLLLFYL